VLHESLSEGARDRPVSTRAYIQGEQGGHTIFLQAELEGGLMGLIAV
jgi:hypothetical protein